MPTIYREFKVNSDSQKVWSALQDVGAVHTRLASGFVTNTKLEGDVRTITFNNGFVATERIVSIDPHKRRVAYSLMGGLVPHHNASFQVFDGETGTSRIVWITDLFPTEMTDTLEKMIDQGVLAITKTFHR